VGVATFVGPLGPAVIVVSGARVSTVNDRVAGVASVLPAVSIARTSKVWSPSASEESVSGDVQLVHAPPSTRHSNVEPPWSAENAKSGVASGVGPLGPLSIVVCGAVVSRVKEREAGVGSVFPAASVARTSKVCGPSARAFSVRGDVQLAQAPPSTRHSNVAPGSSAEKVKAGAPALVRPLGPLSIVVCGAAVSTVKLREAGVASTLPAVSVARMSNVWAPSASAESVRGDVQAVHAPPSTRHSNVEPASVAVKPKLGDAVAVTPLGPDVIVVSGAVASTVNEREAGVASTLPATSVALTSNVWPPSVSVAAVNGEVQLVHAPVSTRHWKVEPVSLEANWKPGVAELVSPDGPEEIVVCGAVTSTVNERDAGVGSTLPARSMPRTSKVCAPSAKAGGE
jgi:hypothetical protein